MKKDGLQSSFSQDSALLDGPHGRRCICTHYSNLDLVAKASADDEEDFISFSLLHMECIISCFQKLCKKLSMGKAASFCQTDITIDRFAMIE